MIRTLDAERDPSAAPGGCTSYRGGSTGPYEQRTLQGIGHNVPQGAPVAIARAVVDAARLSACRGERSPVRMVT
ncbi:hypothetical protein [Streptomyces massasporeus]|uniref:hypothetical protein n=1 Tax=Streptomyces massasporeus TaxID=67324 RepID=UPI003828C8CD